MPKNNEMLTLFLAILVIIALIDGGAWFLLERWSDINRRTPVADSKQSENEDSSNQIADQSKLGKLTQIGC
ncbi:MAG: hypothetical protein PUP92_03760 [Rhizonema sp. PD38]|nr:hypothetical protein [Rhizonema sp. PD38]